MDGLVDLKIPGGTQPGTTLVMSKRGVPRLGNANSRGDHQVWTAFLVSLDELEHFGCSFDAVHLYVSQMIGRLLCQVCFAILADLSRCMSEWKYQQS